MPTSGMGSVNPLLYLARKTWRYSSGNHRNVIIFQCMFIVAQLLVLFVSPLSRAKMLDAVVEVINLQRFDSAQLRTICILASIPFFVRLLNWALHGPGRVLENDNAFRARAKFREFTLGGILGLPLEWHNEHHSGDIIDKAEKGANSLFDFSADSFEVTYSLLRFFGSFAVLAWCFPQSIPILAFFIVLTIVVTVRFDKVLVPQYRELSRAENWASEGIFDAISNISTVIILRVEHLVFDGLMKRVWNRYDVYKKNNVLNELKWFATSMCASLMTTSVFVWYFWYYRHDLSKISIGTVFILYRYLEEISETFFSFTNMYGWVIRRAARMANADELSQDFVEQSLTNHVLPEDWATLEVKNLSFSYHTEEGDLHLDDVSFKARRGEKIALVGYSGAGKTTLLKIIRDLYHPHGHTLTVDDREIIEGFGGIARAISLVPQSPEIFKTSIRENITLGADYDDETIRQFVDMACFTDVVKKLPKGLDSSVKEKGVNLSGGEQQRLALTRGLLASADKDIVLLDEPTASIDAANEMEIYQKIFEGFKGKTIISTIHRLHLLPKFDRICVFERGKIVAEGTLDELLSSSDTFLDLWLKYTVERESGNMSEIGQ